MKSLRELYKIGNGPSSSHTMGPQRAAEQFLRAFPGADAYTAVLFGSLARTGRGHRTDWILKKTLEREGKPAEIRFDMETREEELPHPNTFTLTAKKQGKVLGKWRVMSVGGGAIRVEGQSDPPSAEVYALSTFAEISAYCRAHKLRLYEYVEQEEGPEIWGFLERVWQAMKQAILDGLETEGELEGGLHIERKAKFLYNQRHMDESAQTRENRLVSAYAFAVSEQNAGGGQVVTAPTCGASGVLPAVLMYMQQTREVSDRRSLRALATAGLMGNLIKTNASISGAECGCQAEIGSACAMAAAGLAEMFGMELEQIEYAAEVALEHHLGLTCDPIAGLVQIPCIERNAVAAMRAINALSLANFLTYTRKMSFDLVVRTMYETGKDLHDRYRETSEGGLAKLYQ